MADQATNTLSLNQLQPNPLQPRGAVSAESLSDLTESIKEHGVLEPLIVAHTPAGYQIIAGERRWRASKLAGLDKVPVIIKETTPQGMLEMALVENVQRTDLNPIERAKAFDRLIQEFNLTSSGIASRISKSTAYVSNSLRLLKLPDALKDGLLSGLITEGHARALAGIEDIRTMVEAYKIILRESGSVRRAEELARRMRKKKVDRSQKRPDVEPLIADKEIDGMKKNLRQALGDAAKVKLTRSRVETRLQIILKGSVEDTSPTLKKIYQALTAKS
jgi:ParB family chromosome partitioning protein